MIRHLFRIGGLGLLVAGVIFLLTAVALTAEAQSPGPSLTFTKTATDSVPGGKVSYTLAVSNPSGSPSGSQTIQDTLSSDFEWTLAERNIECDLVAGLGGGQVLHCGPFIVPAGGFDGTLPKPGVSFVTIVAEANECGSWANTALLRDEETQEVTTSTVATLNVVCPTPTPVPPTATPTSPPAATATPTFPAEPSVIIVTATPTKGLAPGVATPRPPNTGGGPLVENTEQGYSLAFLTSLLILLGIGFALAAWAALTGRHR